MDMIKYEYRVEPSIEAEQFDIKKFNEDPSYYPMLKFDPITSNIINIYESTRVVNDGDYIIRELSEDRYFEYYTLSEKDFKKEFREVRIWEENLQ